MTPAIDRSVVSEAGFGGWFMPANLLRNEAAEWLRECLHVRTDGTDEDEAMIAAVDAALAEERRLVVAQIRDRLPMFTAPDRRYLAAFLDEVEADRA
jgi:hypothetical protein